MIWVSVWTIDVCLSLDSGCATAGFKPIAISLVFKRQVSPGQIQRWLSMQKIRGEISAGDETGAVNDLFRIGLSTSYQSFAG